MRNRFDEQLEQLNKKIIEMGALCESAIDNSAKALIEGNIAIAKKAIAFDDEIDEKEKEIENLCLKLLLQQQPVASDLRLISAALKMITDMERIGDQAADIAEIITLDNLTGFNSSTHIQDMAKATIKMVTDSVDAFVKKDLALANKVVKDDDIVDNLFNKVKNEIIIKIQEDGNFGENAIDLLMVAKYFERIGDHATNIAEWVEFSIIGMHTKESEGNDILR